jgi:hypothetical protein
MKMFAGDAMLLDFCELRTSCCDDDIMRQCIEEGEKGRWHAVASLLSFWLLLWPLGRGYEIISWAMMGASPATMSISSHFVAGPIPSSTMGAHDISPKVSPDYFSLIVFFFPARVNRGGRPAVILNCTVHNYRWDVNLMEIRRYDSQ